MEIINDYIILPKSTLFLVFFLAYLIVPVLLGYIVAKLSPSDENLLDRLLDNNIFVFFFFGLWIGSFLMGVFFKTQVLLVTVILNFIVFFILGYSRKSRA